MSVNFHPLEVVSRYRDPQLQVTENFEKFDYPVVDMPTVFFRRIMSLGTNATWPKLKILSCGRS